MSGVVILISSISGCGLGPLLVELRLAHWYILSF